MSRKIAQRSRSRKAGHRNVAARRKRHEIHGRQAKPSRGAAAAERASAGMGTEDFEPTDWLFGEMLIKAAPRPY